MVVFNAKKVGYSFGNNSWRSSWEIETRKVSCGSGESLNLLAAVQDDEMCRLGALTELGESSRRSPPQPHVIQGCRTGGDHMPPLAGRDRS